MSEDIFRIVVTVAVALACLAFLVQAGVAVALYRVVRKMQEKISPLVEKGQGVAEKAGPVIEKIGPLLDQARPVVQKAGPAVDKVTEILATSGKILEETRPRIAEIAADTAATVKSGRQQVERIGELLHDATGRAQDRLEQIDRSVDSTVEQVEHAGESVKRAMMRPVREVNGIAAGVSAAVATLVGRSRKSSVDHATQDEEMFI